MTDTSPPTLVFVGHVDHGKSSLLGRLVLTADKGRASNIVRQFSTTEVESAYLLDQLEEERARSMTIDTTEIFVNLGAFPFRFVDCPGHLELVKNMVSGASRADGAVLVVDVTLGAEPQTVKHVEILALLGIKKVLVAVNKMDLLGDEDQGRGFSEVSQQMSRLLEDYGLQVAAVVPVSARCGLGIEIAAYPAALTLIDALTTISWRTPTFETPLVFPVQRLQDGMLLGSLVSGSMWVGDRVRIPRIDQLGIVRRILQYPTDLEFAEAPSSVAIEVELQNKDAVVLESDLVISAEQRFESVRQVQARVVWLGDEFVERAYLSSYNRKIPVRVGQDEGPMAYADVRTVTLDLEEPLVRFPDMREFVLNRVLLHGRNRVVAGGFVE